MTYEQTPVKTTASRKVATKDTLSALDTKAIIWHLVKRHKFGLVTAYALVLTVFYLMPFVPDMLFALIGR